MMSEDYQFPFSFSENPYHERRPLKLTPFVQIAMVLNIYFPPDEQSPQDITSNIGECPAYPLFFPFERYYVLNPDIIYAIKMLCCKPNLTAAEAKRAKQVSEMFKNNQINVDVNW